MRLQGLFAAAFVALAGCAGLPSSDPSTSETPPLLRLQAVDARGTPTIAADDSRAGGEDVCVRARRFPTTIALTASDAVGVARLTATVVNGDIVQSSISVPPLEGVTWRLVNVFDEATEANIGDRLEINFSDLADGARRLSFIATFDIDPSGGSAPVRVSAVAEDAGLSVAGGAVFQQLSRIEPFAVLGPGAPGACVNDG